MRHHMLYKPCVQATSLRSIDCYRSDAFIGERAERACRLHTLVRRPPAAMPNSRPPIAALLAYLHPTNEPILQLVDVLHHLIREHFSRPLSYNLVHANRGAAIRLHPERSRLDVRVDRRPLTFPIPSDTFSPLNPAALPTIWPVDFRVHRGQSGLKVATFEGRVKTPQQEIRIHQSTRFQYSHLRRGQCGTPNEMLISCKRPLTTPVPSRHEEAWHRTELWPPAAFVGWIGGLGSV
jgi:hypothetical protein